MGRAVCLLIETSFSQSPISKWYSLAYVEAMLHCVAVTLYCVGAILGPERCAAGRRESTGWGEILA